MSVSPLQLRPLAIVFFTLSIALAFVTPALAGGGPENVLLVVNAHSRSSMTIANHYVALRRIPTPNIVYLDWEGTVEGIDVATFREKILGPVMQAMLQRGLSYQIDYIVYSADFPTRVDFTADVPPEVRGKLAATASITSLTYYYAATLTGAANVYVSLTSNYYMRQPTEKGDISPSHGFRGWYGWSDTGELLEAGGSRYLLSTMLGVTSGRGNTVDEVISYLKRSAAVDGTAPKGTVYFAEHDDVRSKTRQPGFATAAKALEKLGLGAQIIPTTLPDGKRDVIGAMLGSASAPWGASQSKIRPGAIIDNLTSCGGMMGKGDPQTPLTEFLRNGAAGASGTVVEPYAIPNKFAAPSIFVHYARGCTLAEAYYQSVWGPYNLLIVGDPLCRPWAKIPTISVSGVESGATIKGEIQLRPTAVCAPGHAVDRFELFVNGLRVAHCPAGGMLQFDTSKLADGFCELRVVGIDSDPIETQGDLVVYTTTANRGHQVELRASASPDSGGAELNLAVSAPGMAEILLFDESRPLGAITGDKGELRIETKSLGLGPSVLRAVAKSADGATALSRPISIDVEAAK